jgi:hypothetical protein
VLPGGFGFCALNVSMTRGDSEFMKVLKLMSGEFGKFAPALGLPAISILALKSFSSLYGALEQRTTFLLNCNPVRVFTTRRARRESGTRQGLNLVAGDYVLVPQVQSRQLAEHFSRLELKQSYLVEKGTPGNASVFDLALDTPPDITYFTVNIGVHPLQRL